MGRFHWVDTVKNTGAWSFISYPFLLYSATNQFLYKADANHVDGALRNDVVGGENQEVQLDVVDNYFVILKVKLFFITPITVN